MSAAGLRGMGSRFIRYLRDGRVPLWKKLTGLLAVAYLLFPADAVPDVIPFLGWLDDLGVLSATAFWMMRQVQQHPPEPRPGEAPREQGGRPRPS